MQCDALRCQFLFDRTRHMSVPGLIDLRPAQAPRRGIISRIAQLVASEGGPGLMQ
jgi:hypothetical protein